MRTIVTRLGFGAAPLLVVGLLAFASPAWALRPLSADRPDVTESPYSVDAGYMQIEASWVEYTHTAGDWQILPINFKVGLSARSDVQLLFTPYNIIDGGEDGSGDLILRNKWNLWGNDEGAWALGVMPFIKLPTNRGDSGNRFIEGGIIVPLAMALSESLGLGAMVEVDFIRNRLDDGFDSEFLHTATIGTALFEELSGFVEFAGSFLLNEADDYNAQFNLGLTYGLSEMLQLDSGVRFGLTDSADELVVFSGFSYKFKGL